MQKVEGTNGISGVVDGGKFWIETPEGKQSQSVVAGVLWQAITRMEPEEAAFTLTYPSVSTVTLGSSALGEVTFVRSQLLKLLIIGK